MIDQEQLTEEDWKKFSFYKKPSSQPKKILTIDESVTDEDIRQKTPWTPELQTMSTQVDNSFRELQAIENKPAVKTQKMFKLPEVELGKSIVKAMQTPSTSVQKAMMAIDEMASNLPKRGVAAGEAIQEAMGTVGEDALRAAVPKAKELLLGPMLLPYTGYKIAKAINAPEMVGGMVAGTAESMKEMFSNPLDFIKEKPDEFINNVLIIASAGMGAGLGVGKLKGIATARRLGKYAETMEFGGQLSGKQFKELVKADETLSYRVKEAARISVPDDAVITKGTSVPGWHAKGIGHRSPEVLLRKFYEGDPSASWRQKTATIGRSFNSPDVVFAVDKYGQRIYDTIDTADRQLRMFTERYRNWHNKVLNEAGIKKRSPVDLAVNKIRNGGFDVDDVIRMEPAQARQLYDPVAKRPIGLTEEEIVGIRSNVKGAKALDNFYDIAFDETYLKWGTDKVGPAKAKELYAKAREIHGKKEAVKEFEKTLNDKQLEVFKQYKDRYIKKYMPHIFDDEMEEILAKQAMALDSRLKGMTEKNPEYKDLARQREIATQALDNLRNQGFDWRTELPKELKFGAFEKRIANLPGYNPSAIESFESYLYGIGRKIFKEGALEKVKPMIQDIDDPALREYAKKYARRYIGWDKSPLDSLANNIKGIVWMEKLGLNPRSALVNWTQKINTIAAEPQLSAKGWLAGHTDPNMRALFDASGLKQTVPTVLMEGGAGANAIEKIRQIAGFMFSKVEEGNLRHAFSTGYLQARKMGMVGKNAFEHAIKFAEKTQFRYGAVNTPMALRGWGGVAFQFWSYPIKQLEFLGKLWKEDPRKVIGWIAMAEGAKETVDELVGADLSNSLGLGLNYGHLFKMLDNLSKGGEGDVTRYHAAMSGLPVVGESGGGIAPYGLGPAVESMKTLTGKLTEGTLSMGDLMKELVPTQFQRMYQGYKAIKEGPDQEGNYLIRSFSSDNPQYREPLSAVVGRTLFARPSTETRQADMVKRDRIIDKLGDRALRELGRLIVLGKDKEALDFMEKRGIAPTRQAIQNAIDFYYKTPSERLDESKSRAIYEERFK